MGSTFEGAGQKQGLVFVHTDHLFRFLLGQTTDKKNEVQDREKLVPPPKSAYSSYFARHVYVFVGMYFAAQLGLFMGPCKLSGKSDLGPRRNHNPPLLIRGFFCGRSRMIKYVTFI